MSNIRASHLIERNEPPTTISNTSRHLSAIERLTTTVHVDHVIASTLYRGSRKLNDYEQMIDLTLV